jgi:hypothetical protein
MHVALTHSLAITHPFTLLLDSLVSQANPREHSRRRLAPVHLTGGSTLRIIWLTTGRFRPWGAARTSSIAAPFLFNCVFL